MNIDNIQPLPGNAIVRMEDFLQDTGGIELPESVKGRGGNTAIVLAMNAKVCVNLKRIKLVGERVLLKSVAGRREIDKDRKLFLIHVDNIIAIVGSDVVINGRNRANERCRFCDATKDTHQGILMVDHPTAPRNIVCPMCERDINGKKVDMDAMAEMTEDDHALMRANIYREREFRNPKRLATIRSKVAQARAEIKERG